MIGQMFARCTKIYIIKYTFDIPKQMTNDKYLKIWVKLNLDYDKDIYIK